MTVRMWLVIGLLMLGTQFVVGCAAPGTEPPVVPAQPQATIQPTPTSMPKPAQVALQFQASDADILNPERGLFTPMDLPATSDFSIVRTANQNTLIRSYVRLDAYRETDLPQTFLDELDQSMDGLRQAGIKTVLRFAYNAGPYPDSEPDASREQVLRHIEQLTPLLQKHADVIVWMEAGFVGAWGEWHTSTNGIDTIENKRIILTALLRALPASRTIQVRYPPDIVALVGPPPTAEQAYDGSDRSRIGHHNDCFLASDDDWGTYYRDGVNTRDQDQADLTMRTRYTSMGGETCNPNPPRSDCPTALEELALLHFSSINEYYHQRVVRLWKTQGCYDTIRQKLGYRLALTGGSVTDRVAPGSAFDLSLQLTNTGFAAPVNERPVYVVLDGPASYRVRLAGVDGRQWQPGSPITLTARLRLPDNAPPGEYRLALWLPDPAESLQQDARYAIQLANQNTWEAATGLNILTTSFQVDPAMVPTSDTTAQEFVPVR